MPHQINNNLTLDRLREVLDYDPASGAFLWKQARPDLIGKPAGCVGSHHGYRVIRIDYHLYRGSRLAWLFMTGEWPAYLIDHIDGRRDNDAFVNLREASSHENNANRRTAKSASGFKGVYRNKRDGFIVRLTSHRRSIHVGTFKTRIEAAAAYNRAAVEHFGQFAKLNQV